MYTRKRTLLSVGFLLLFISAQGQLTDISGARIFLAEKDNPRLKQCADILREETFRRTGIMLQLVRKQPRQDEKQIIIGVDGRLKNLNPAFSAGLERLARPGAEGFRIVQTGAGQILIAGSDEAGALYGTGWLLRKMELRKNSILVPSQLSLSSAPAYPVRGHQLGYRPKTNAYDAWTPAQFDSYIRDLLIFGANSIEIMPPRTDDDATSENMKMPALTMIAEQSRICAKYGMKVWMWYPNMGSDYSSPDSVSKELMEREQVFSALPRLDAVFVPAGDPGDLEPDVLFGWLARVAGVLHKYHPEARIWVSPQVFKPGKKWYSDFYRHVNKKYDWFGGLVYGPWIRTPLPEVRKLIDPAIPVRLYPDITHSLSCQYPVPDWDLAFAMTLGRECINPRPLDEKYIHNFYAPLAIGSISYSEGTNDDVNKFVWTGQDWDPSSPVQETLRDYARFFIGPDYTEGVAQGLLALERNFRGPLLVNDNVWRTLQQWQDMESAAPADVLSNPRFQSGLLRAYFDSYIQRRLIYETALESEARTILAQAGQTGSLEAISAADSVLLLAREKPVATYLKDRCLALADSLYRSWGAQLTVEKHHAMGGRGNFIDNIDIPLNDALWLLDQLKSAGRHGGEPERLEAISRILKRTDPGPGGFYDDFGTPSSSARIIARKTWEEDPGSLEGPRVSFGVGLVGTDWVHEVVARGFEGQTTPLAWMNQINTLYDTPLEIGYDNLDTSAIYTLKIGYTGRFRSNMRLMADGVLIHDYIRMGTRPLYEFTLPAELTRDGKVVFTWTCGTDDTGEGERGSQVAELWLIRRDRRPGAQP